MAKFIPSSQDLRRFFQGLHIILNSDDGEEDYDTTWYQNGYASNGISVGHDGTGSCDAGLRFLRPNIPNNCEIVSAKLRVRANANASFTPVNLKIKGIKEVSPNTFAADGSNRPSIRAKTTAVVDWDIAGAWTTGQWHESPDIKDVIKEIIEQPEYDGKAIALVIEDDSSASGKYKIISDSSAGTGKEVQLILKLKPIT